MSTKIATRLSFLPVRLLRMTTSLLSLSAILFALTPVAHAANGQISGTVSSKSTGNALQGASVRLPGLDRTTLTDNTGRFVLYDVPAGSVEVVVSYEGFTNATQSVDVSAGPATLAVEMQSSDVITLEKFTVSTVKEGQALSLTEQRNAANVKNVTAFDEWGILPTQNVGELASRLPGITFTTDEDNLINNISIRGQPADYTRLNIDGMSSTGVGGNGRNATLHSFSSSLYEQIEIINGQTPDKRADSLGGQINLKTKSPLAMKEKRRFNYNVSGRFFPSTSDRNVPLANSNIGPDISGSYTEVFDVFGGKRNLGLVINGSYQKVINAHDWDTMLYQNTTNPDAFMRDWTKRSGLNTRLLEAFSARLDYRWRDHTKISARFQYNHGDEPTFHYTFVNPFTSNQTVATLDASGVPTGTGAIVPGFTTNRTQVRIPSTGATATNAGQMLLNTILVSFTSRNPTSTLAFEHDFGRLKIEHAYRLSKTHFDLVHGRNGEAGQLTLRTNAPIGFIFDNTNRNGRVFTQTAGPDVYNPASYNAFLVTAANTTTVPVAQTSVIFNKRSLLQDKEEKSGKIDLSYALDTKFPITLKAGVDTITLDVWRRNPNARRWFAAVDTLPSTDLMPLTEFERQHPGLRLPVFNPKSVSPTLSDPTKWTEDTNFTATSLYTNNLRWKETVDSGYVQATGNVGRLTVLAGVRTERVKLDTVTFFRARTTAIATEPDHFKRAALDFAKSTGKGKYTKNFPSVHLAYNITANLKARASWSSSYGRPTQQQMLPTVTFSDSLQRVTLGNPNLRPQESENIDLKLEYYFKNSGKFTVSVFRKNITDYISGAVDTGLKVEDGPDNGFDGLYSGYSIYGASNVGSARVDGYEIDYSQRLGFLPGALKGLTLRANYTHLKTEGMFAGTTILSGSALANFIPEAFNAGLQYNYRKFSASFDLNHTGKFPILNFSSTSPGTNIFAGNLTTMNMGLSYRLRPEATLFINATNITEQGRSHYNYDTTRLRQLLIAPMAIKFGVTGQF